VNTATINGLDLVPRSLRYLGTVIDVNTLKTVTLVTSKAGTGVASRSIAAHRICVALIETLLQALINVEVAVEVGPTLNARAQVTPNTHVLALGTVRTRISSGCVAIIDIGAFLRWVTLITVFATTRKGSNRVGTNCITTTVVLTQDALILVHVTVLPNPAIVAIARVEVRTLIGAETMLVTSTVAIIVYAVVDVSADNTVSCVPFVA
jgi:hypothetical protein